MLECVHLQPTVILKVFLGCGHACEDTKTLNCTEQGAHNGMSGRNSW